MPAGVDVLVADGFATIDFVDRTKRGPALTALLALGGPDLIETMTRTGPRTLFRVPEGNARQAGLIDEPTTDNSGAAAGARRAPKSNGKHRRRRAPNPPMFAPASETDPTGAKRPAAGGKPEHG